MTCTLDHEDEKSGVKMTQAKKTTCRKPKSRIKVMYSVQRNERLTCLDHGTGMSWANRQRLGHRWPVSEKQ